MTQSLDIYKKTKLIWHFEPLYKAHICQTNNPCQNQCTCEPSCRDADDYVCKSSPGRPFIGKNCEWQVAVNCMANNAVTITVPEAAIASYELTVKNGLIQGCNREDLICDSVTRTCGPATSPVNGFYSLTCSNNALQAFGASFGFVSSKMFQNEPKTNVLF